jgi:ferric-dicitrate binding protein FerR (iron transport regulator)
MEKFNNISEEIQVLIAGYFAGTINKGELEVLNQWIKENDEHQKIFNKIKNTWVLTGRPVNTNNEKISSAFQKVNYNIKRGTDKSVFPFWNMSRIAASWVAIFIIGGLLSIYFSHHISKSNKQKQITSISAPLGSKSQVELPDGTKVWLNAGSKISYNSNFGESTREVTLSGEAYFDVIRKEKCPFLVKTIKLVSIKVLGTAFNVKAYQEEDYVETTVERGKVQVSKSSPESGEINTVTLLPKQKLKIELNTKTLAKDYSKPKKELNPVTANTNIQPKEILLEKNIETKLYTSWKDGEWIIESESLESLATKIERNYNIEIEFKDSELKKYTFSGVLKDETLDQVLELMKLSAPIRYRIEQRKVVLTKNRLFDNSNYNKN